MKHTRRTLLALALVPVLLWPGLGRAGDSVTFEDPVKIADEISAILKDGKTDEAGGRVAELIGIQEQKEKLTGGMAPLRGRQSMFIDTVYDKTWGTSLRQIIHVLPSGGNVFLYLRYNFKRSNDGWILSDFNFQTEPSALFPPEFGPVN